MDFSLLADQNPFGSFLISADIERELLTVSKDQEPSAYLRYVFRIVKAAIGFNESGRYYPVWGTCLGFESLLLVLSNLQVEITAGLDDVNFLHPVVFDLSKKSVFNAIISENDFKQLETEELLYFNHDYGYLYEQTVNHPFVRENIDILAKMTTSKGIDVVAAYQHKKYPFAGIQYHPEKNQFIFSDGMPKTRSDKLTDVGRDHARVVATLFKEAHSSIDFKTFQQLREGMGQIFDDGNQSEAFYFGPYPSVADLL